MATNTNNTQSVQDTDPVYLKSIVDAINRSNAVCEFDLDGTIIRANDNFLSLMGYELEEIVGKHHRIFVDPDYARSAEYDEFWKTLGRGEYTAAEYRRLGKSGREIWLQATYNPVFDADGNPVSVIKFATDVTERKEVEALIDKQQHLLTELSTPTMELFDGIILMPLVGSIDGERATQLISNLLDAIAKHEAEVAILDLTGVPIIDTDVARHILKAVAASKMLGSNVIITGMKPGGAQTLVQLGIDLSHITTKGTLKSGIDEAFRKQGVHIKS
jgi:methyl-accepting chemotaxis protein